MKLSYLVRGLPFIAIAFLIWQWNHTKTPVSTQTPAPANPLREEPADSAPQSRPAPPTESWRVLKIADGDSITVERDGTKEKIRFCGIDTPEVYHGPSSPGQPLGDEAKTFLSRLVSEANNEVQLSLVDTDRYGRKVAEVFTIPKNGGEKFLQEELLKAGLGFHYAKYSSVCPNRDAIVKAEAIARSAGLGVWSGNHEKPWDYRKRNR